MKTHKVCLAYGGFMGEEARRVLETLPNVELVLEWKGKPDADFFLTVSYPRRVLVEDMEGIRAINLHTGFLPKQRGYHPLNWALIWGDRMGGVTLHKTAESIDSGDILVQRGFEITNEDHIEHLRVKAKALVYPILKQFFASPESAWDHAVQQEQSQATYAPRRYASDSQINLNETYWNIYNLWRSCDPKEYPAFVVFPNGERKIVTDVDPLYGKIKFEDGTTT